MDFVCGSYSESDRYLRAVTAHATAISVSVVLARVFVHLGTAHKGTRGMEWNESDLNLAIHIRLLLSCHKQYALRVSFACNLEYETEYVRSELPLTRVL